MDIKTLHKQLGAVAHKSLEIAQDSRLPAAERLRQLAPLEAEMDRLKVAADFEQKKLDIQAAAGASFDDMAVDHGAGRTDLPPSYDHAGWVPGKGQIRSAPTITGQEEQLKHLFAAATSRQSLRIEIKTPIGSSSVAPAYLPDQTPPIPFAREPMRIMDLIPVRPTQAASVDFYTTVGTAGAAAVAEGALKPQSSLTLNRVNVPVIKVAHFVEVTDEALHDYAPFLGILTSDLVAGLIAAENAQVLSGSGVAPNALGILNATGLLTRATGSATNLDVLDQAVTDLRTGARYTEPTAIVMHPANLSATRRLKDTTGRYLAGDPTASGASSIWGIPVVTTTAMPLGTALVGNFSEGVQGVVRDAIRVETNAMGTAQWTYNTCLVRAEERFAVCVTTPAALCKVTGLA